jgi:hypothetical protein
MNLFILFMIHLLYESIKKPGKHDFVIIRKDNFNWVELLESLHLLAPAGEMVFIPDFAFKFVTPEVSQNYLSCCDAIRRHHKTT